jgi:peroxiredoxin
VHDPTKLPVDLPIPVDDGAADHLQGLPMPALALPSTLGGAPFRVDWVPAGHERLILYAYALTGLPGVEAPPGWDAIPGARGCTPESCGFRDHAAELAWVGAAVAGLSTQSSTYQLAAVDRLGLPFPLLSDANLLLTEALRLPTFTMSLPTAYDGGGRRVLLKRLTIVVRGSGIEKVFYPVFPPDHHAEEVLAWIGGRSRRGGNSATRPLIGPQHQRDRLAEMNPLDITNAHDPDPPQTSGAAINGESHES